MPKLTDLRIQSLDKDDDNPRIDLIEAPHVPAVGDGVVNATDLTATQIAKLSGDEMVEALAGLVRNLKAVSSAAADGDDDELAGILGDMAAALKARMATVDEMPEAEEAAQEAIKKLRDCEAGRAISRKNLDTIKSAMKALKAAIPLLRQLVAVAERNSKKAEEDEKPKRKTEAADMVEEKAQALMQALPFSEPDASIPEKIGAEEARKELGHIVAAAEMAASGVLEAPAAVAAIDTALAIVAEKAPADAAPAIAEIKTAAAALVEEMPAEPAEEMPAEPAPEAEKAEDEPMPEEDEAPEDVAAPEDMTCPNCGDPVAKGETECPTCGLPVRDMLDDEEAEEEGREGEAAGPEWERHFEAVHIDRAEVVELDKGKPYIHLECTFAQAGVSKNGGRRYRHDVMKRVVESGGYNAKPYYPYHHSDEEVKQFPDGIRSRREGMTGPPAKRPEEVARFEDETGKVKGHLYITKPEAVAQYRNDVEAGFDMNQVLPGLSHDIRSKSVYVKTADFEGRDITDYRVASLDGATVPALGGGDVRQVAAYTGDDAMADNKSAVKQALAALDTKKEAIQEETRLAEHYGLPAEGETHDRFVEWASGIDSEKHRPTPERIKEEVTKLTAKPESAPKGGVARTTESRVEQGATKMDRLKDDMIRFFDVKGYVEKRRAAEEGRPIRYGEHMSAHRTNFTSFTEIVKEAVSDTYRDNKGRPGEVTVKHAAQVLNASNVYEDADRNGELSSYSGRSIESAAQVGEERDTESLKLKNDECGRYISRATGDTRFTEALLTGSLGQFTADVKHLVAMTTFGELQGGNTALFPSSDIVVSETVSVPQIGETHRHARRQKMTANAPTVAEGAAYLPTTEPADQEESGAHPTKYGFTLDLSIELMSRVPGIEAEMPNDIGEALDARDRRLAFNILTDSTVTLSSDGVALFNAASHSNAVTTAMSYDNVSALQADMRQQKAYAVGTGANQQGQPVMAKHLVVADELLNQAYELFSLGEDPRTGNRAASAIVNPKNPPLTIWSLPLLDYGSNQDDYFLIADGSQSGVHLQARYVWSGQPQRAVFVADTDENGVKYSNDLVSMKGRLIVGYLLLDYRFMAGGIVP